VISRSRRGEDKRNQGYQRHHQQEPGPLLDPSRLAPTTALFIIITIVLQFHRLYPPQVTKKLNL
jgi:hypothetical protein